MELLDNLKRIQGQPLKYCQLCEELGIERKGTRSKIAQLKQLQMYCDFEVLEKPTRYVVKEVYTNEIKAFESINANNKYQVMFDAVIYQTFLENHNNPIYLSTTDMLKLFAEVNENFVYACNGEQMYKLGEEYLKFSVMGQVAKRILARWTQSRLTNMHNRSLLVKTIGYRLYTKHKGQYGYFKVGHNISPDTEVGKKCMAIFAQAYEDTVPNNLKKVKDINCWLPNQIYKNLNDRVTELTIEKFDGEYCDLKRVTLLLPPEQTWVTTKLAEIYKSLPALHDINEEACRKILATSQLDEFTGADRKRFIEVNLALSPKVSLKKELMFLKNPEK